MPDELLGELVVACVVPHVGVDIDEELIRNFVKEKLASYKVPRRVLFFDDDDFHTTGTAKIKTSDLRELAVKRLNVC